MNIIMEITKELNKKSLLNCYPIYISYRCSVLILFNLALKSIYYPYLILIFIIRTPYYIYIL